MPEPTTAVEPPPHNLGSTTVSRVWIECTLLCVLAACSALQASTVFMDSGRIDIRAVVGIIGAVATNIISYMNRNAARHSAAKDADGEEETQ